jgi:hypothetical protein
MSIADLVCAGQNLDGLDRADDLEDRGRRCR